MQASVSHQSQVPSSSRVAGWKAGVSLQGEAGVSLQGERQAGVMNTWKRRGIWHDLNCRWLLSCTRICRSALGPRLQAWPAQQHAASQLVYVV